MPNFIAVNTVTAYTNISKFGKLNIAKLKPTFSPFDTSHLNDRQFSQVLVIGLSCIHHKQQDISHLSNIKKEDVSETGL
jgi:hypothetical protein